MLSEQRQRFADFYIETCNATESARRAGYSEKTAYSQGQRLLKNVEIKQYIQERMEGKSKKRIADQDEIMEFLTKILRGEEKDQFGFDTSNRDKLEAAKILSKRYETFTSYKEKKELDLQKQKLELDRQRLELDQKKAKLPGQGDDEEETGVCFIPDRMPAQEDDQDG